MCRLNVHAPLYVDAAFAYSTWPRLKGKQFKADEEDMIFGLCLKKFSLLIFLVIGDVLDEHAVLYYKRLSFQSGFLRDLFVVKYTHILGRGYKFPVICKRIGRGYKFLTEICICVSFS